MGDREEKEQEEHNRRAADDVSDGSHLRIERHQRSYDREQNDHDQPDRPTPSITADCAMSGDQRL